MKTPPPTILGVGLIALDVVSGGTDHASEQGLYAGGTCGNVMTLLAFLGWNAMPVGRLDHDAAGNHVRADMKRFGVGLRYIALEPTARTPVVMQRILVDANGHPRHVFTWSCAECGARFPGYQAVTLSAVDSLMTSIGSIPSVLFCDRASPAAAKLAEYCRERGSIIFFEAAGVGSPNHFRRMLDLAHVLKYSHETQKAVDLLQSENPDTALLEIETLGAGGLRYRLRTGKDRRWHERQAFSAPRLRDTAGSGDWLTAGVIDRACRGGLETLRSADASTVVDALDYGQSLSAWNCAFEGARGGMYGMTPARLAKVVTAIQAHSIDSKKLDTSTPSRTDARYCGECSISSKKPTAASASAKQPSRKRTTKALPQRRERR